MIVLAVAALLAWLIVAPLTIGVAYLIWWCL